jgi:poly(3-hydroxybutyrate) depolymerase
MHRALPLLLLVTGCAAPTSPAADDDDTPPEPRFGRETIGGDRPARTVVPANWDGVELLPVIVLLHGYRMNGDIQDFYFGYGERVDRDRFILILPTGEG